MDAIDLVEEELRFKFYYGGCLRVKEGRPIGAAISHPGARGVDRGPGCWRLSSGVLSGTGLMVRPTQ